MIKVSTDNSKELLWVARRGTDNVLSFNFTSSSLAFDISGYTFSLYAFRFGAEYLTLSNAVISLTQGSGLTNSGVTGVLTATITHAQSSALTAKDYFFYLKVVKTSDSTVDYWFNGKLQLNKELWIGEVSTSVSTSISLTTQTIDVTIDLGGSGASTFISLTDTPNSYSGQTLKYVRVNAGETGLEFTSAAGFTLTNGNGTTANGTAVDLGGDAVNDIFITNLGNNKTFSIGDGFTDDFLSVYLGGGGASIQLSSSGIVMGGIGQVISSVVSGYLIDVSGLYTSRSWTDKGYVDSKLASKNISAPAVGQNGQSVRWNNGTVAWEYFTPTTVSAAALTKTDDTNVTLTLGGTPGTALLQAASITVGWTGTLAYSRFVSGTGLSVVGRSANSSGVQADIVGTANQVLRVSGTTLGFGAVDLTAMVGATVLPVANGGTNIASYAVGDILYASAGTTLSKLADVAAGSYLRSGGVTTAPVWSTTTLPNSASTGDIMYASGSNAYANLASVATGSVLGSAGTTTAPAYLAVSNGLTATATTFKWGGSLTAATTITGSSTNTITYVFPSLGSTQTDGAGLWIQNNTAAAAGVQQRSGLLTFEGQGWKTNATAGTQSVKWGIDLLPVQGTANPSAQLVFSSNINAGGYTSQIYFLSDGSINFVNSSNYIQFNAGNGLIQANAGGMRVRSGSAGSSVQLENASTSVNGAVDILVSASTFTQTTGTGVVFQTNKTFQASSGTATWTVFDIPNVINTTSTYSGLMYFLRYHPTLTSVTGLTHYGVVIEPTACLNGFGIALPTATLHVVGSTILAGSVKLAGTNSTGAGSAALGANSPASTLTAPYTWVTVLASDGSTCYLPIWK